MMARFMGILHFGLYRAKLIVGSTLVALSISLGMVIVLRQFGLSIDPSLAAITGVVGGAIHAKSVIGNDKRLGI